MSAPIQPPRAMAVHLVGFLGLPWRIWSYLVSTLFGWGLIVLVFFPIGLIGKAGLILAPFLGAVGLAWPRGGRHMDEWIVLAWGYVRAKGLAERQRAQARRRLSSTHRLLPGDLSDSAWDALPPPVEATWREVSVGDEDTVFWEEEPADAEDEERGDLDQDFCPTAGVFSNRPRGGAPDAPTVAEWAESPPVVPRTQYTVPAPLYDFAPGALPWDEESGAFIDDSGAFLLDVSLGQTTALLPRLDNRRRMLPLPEMRSRRRAAGH